MSTAKKKIVLVDMDGVIANFELGYERAITKMFPSMKLIPREERNVFYNDVQYAHIYPQHEDAFHRIALKPGFFRHLPVMEGAKAAMKALNKKYNLFICTSPMTEYYNCVREKYEWVEEHLGFDFTSKMILTRDKTVVTGHVLIDDKPIIKGCMVPTWSQVVFDQPYNTETRGFRVKSWNQIDKLMDYIDSL
ncbi:putative 5'(3')-deoxyribonucleotidase [Convolutriloba macropyga]|uniref:putative 5'(3')-deoxyribonucleotidase n=1 Tax=Convolutriloba macropyga TaxID=536237 RepID=UPI003F528297